MKFKTGDKVRVMRGKDAGKEGQITKVLKSADKVVVEGINMIKKHQKPNNTNPQGGIIDKEAPIHVSNVMLLDPETKVVFDVRDGEQVKKGQHLATVTGDVRVLLSGERTALNYLQRLSGIATYTHTVAGMLEGTRTKLLDTRKTTPCMRVFEKYAVRIGGGQNHRYNLSDGVLLKDNHIDAAGGVREAVAAAKAYAPFVRKIEVETENLDMVKDAVDAGADIIMLDNMTPEQMAEAIRLIDGRAKTECSGNMTKENIRTVTELGVDYVSSGALTHSAPILDISLKHLKVLTD